MKVADLTNPDSPQPKRARVRLAVGEILEGAGNSEKSGYPLEFTHRELARLVYGVEEPTSAQKSAVRRAVAELVKASRAERLPFDRRLNAYGHGGTGLHQRVSPKGYAYVASNPAGIVVRRALTAADREARAQVAEQAGYAEYAEEIRAGKRS